MAALNLTDDDVNNILKKVSKADAKEINDIYQQYSNALSATISMALKQAKQASDESEIVELERLKRIIGMAPIEERFIRSKDKIWMNREHILKKDSDYFLNKDYSVFIKKDHNQMFMETLIDLIKDKFTTLDDAAKAFYWNKAAEMLNAVARFKKITGDHI